MDMHAYQSYEDAVQDYLARFKALRDTPPSQSLAVTRGAGDIPAEALVERASEIAGVSAAMVPLAREYLNAPDPVVREGVSGQLLAQAAAELQVAMELFEIAASEDSGPSGPEGSTARPITRAARGASLREAIDSMERVMLKPVSAGIELPVQVHRSVALATNPEEARQALVKAADITASAISQRVVEVGGDLAFHLVFHTEWSEVIQGAGLLSKDVAKLLDRVKEGASQLIQGALATAVKTILNVFDKVLALLGKDAEDQARQQIQQWLEDMKEKGKIELFSQLVTRLYQVDKLKAALPEWMEKTTADLDKLNATSAEVAALSGKFTVLVERINTVGDVVGLSRFVQAQFPQVLVVATAIRVALLAVLVYGGYDYIGYGQANVLNLTRGVVEVLRENLAI